MLELDKSKKDKAILLEILFGLFFIFGIGWLYAGNKVRGSLLLLGTIIGALSSVYPLVFATSGLGFFCCAPVLYLTLIFDVLSLRKWLQKPVIESLQTTMKKGFILFAIGLVIIIISIIVILIRLPNILKAFGI